MNHWIQEELFGLEHTTRPCARCRQELPRTPDFFPAGSCRDGYSSFCRKCSQSSPEPVAPPDNLRLLDPMREKRCETCRQVRSLQEFFMDSRSQDGKSWVCKSCGAGMPARVALETNQTAIGFIQDTRNQRVKVIISRNLRDTLGQLQDGASVPLQLLAVERLESPDEAEDRFMAYQELLQADHVFNNWYASSRTLGRILASLRGVRTPAPTQRQKLS